MFSKTNIEKQLLTLRNKRIGEDAIMEEVRRIFSENDKMRKKTISLLAEKSKGTENNLNFNLLEPKNVFHIEDIKKLCATYRLRFLDSHYFKGNFPEEAISEIHKLEKDHKTHLRDFKIIAPAKLLKLKNADDPLLFVPVGNNYHYLVHKWGNDLHPFRKTLMWPYKSLENLLFMIFILSIVLTAIIPLNWFSKTGGIQEEILLFLFIFKMICGIVLYYGFAKGKNFNGAVWNSKYYN